MLIFIGICLILFIALSLTIFSGIDKNKKCREPLTEDEQNHYFTKLVMEISQEIKNIKDHSGIKIFLQKNKTDKIDLFKLSRYYYRKSNAEAAFMLSSVVASTMSASAKEVKKMEEIILIKNMWEFFCIKKIDSSNFSKKEMAEVKKDIDNALSNILNDKILLSVNERDAAKAWDIILKDESLTLDMLLKLFGYTRENFISSILNKNQNL